MSRKRTPPAPARKRKAPPAECRHGYPAVNAEGGCSLMCGAAAPAVELTRFAQWPLCACEEPVRESEMTCGACAGALVRAPGLAFYARPSEAPEWCAYYVWRVLNGTADVDAGDWRAVRVSDAEREKWPEIGPRPWVRIELIRDRETLLVERISEAEMMDLVPGMPEVEMFLASLAPAPAVAPAPARGLVARRFERPDGPLVEGGARCEACEAIVDVVDGCCRYCRGPVGPVSL